MRPQVIGKLCVILDQQVYDMITQDLKLNLELNKEISMVLLL